MCVFFPPHFPHIRHTDRKGKEELLLVKKSGVVGTVSTTALFVSFSPPVVLFKMDLKQIVQQTS